MANESRALLSSWGEPVLGLDRAGALPLVFTGTADQTLEAGESQLRGQCSASLLNAMMKNGINWKRCLWYFFCFRYGKSQIQPILIKLSGIYAIFDHEDYMRKAQGVLSLLKLLSATFSLQITDRMLHKHLFLSVYKFYFFICYLFHAKRTSFPDKIEDLKYLIWMIFSKIIWGLRLCLSSQGKL